MKAPLLTLQIGDETDVVTARKRARQIAGALGFDAQDQTRVATAVSEIARNAFQYGIRGRAQYGVELEPEPQLVVEIADEGPGILDVQTILDGGYQSRTGMGVGITGARKLMDAFEIETRPGHGTSVQLRKLVPGNGRGLGSAAIARIGADLVQQKADNPLDEVRQQNQELVRALESERRSQGELQLLNRELEETNRGVMVLYNELEEKAETLRRTHESKSRFFSEMNHEVRTPINSILSLSELLLAGNVVRTAAEQEKALGYIRKSAQQLSELIDDMLDLAKSEAGKMVVHVRDVSIDDVFGGLRGMFRPLHLRSEVALVFEDVHALPTMQSDDGKLSQILRNFISNALKFTESGTVTVSAHEDRDDIVFSVRDTGMGIAPEHHASLFEPFVQVDNPRQRKVKGTGLGLSVTRVLATLLGGHVSVQSAVGGGSTFSARIPRVYQPPLGVRSDPPPVLGTQPERVVLVIDDDEVARYLLRLALGAGFSVLEAKSGKEGLSIARSGTPSAIFLDLHMPGMTGYEVLDALKADARTSAIPVVIHTSQVIDQAASARLSNHSVAIVQKATLNQPEGLQALASALRKAGL